MNASREDFENAKLMLPPIGECSKEEKEFRNTIEKKYNVKIGDYWDFHKWSVENINEFWTEVWNRSEIKFSKTYDKVIDLNIPLADRPQWFEGARLNYVENILKYKDDHIALVTTGEDRQTERYSYAEVYEQATLYAAAFKKLGLKKGDVVVCYMSNREEAVFAMLAAVSLGAVWTGALPLLGSQAVLSRFQQVKPKFMITVDRFLDNKEEFEMLQKVKKISDGLPSLEKVIIVPTKNKTRIKDAMIGNSCLLDEFLKFGIAEDGSVPPIEFEQVSFQHPVFINYTSGTTGLPKPVVHGSCALLPMCREFCLQGAPDRTNVFLAISPVGWASWNLILVNFFNGVTVVLYEGSPYFLSPTYLWDIVDRFKVRTVFLPPSILDEMEKKDYVPTKNNSLSSLMVVVSGSSVVKPHNYDFVYNKIKRNMLFFSIYGSTEVLGACSSYHRSLPIYRGEIACSNLGNNLVCIDDSGTQVIGEVGELVISRPFPTLPLGLWGDEDGSLFKRTYFYKFQDKFAMGDLGAVNPFTRGIVVYCRSDETLKPGGCRFGSSEIYNVVNALPEIHDSLCVSQYSQNRTERVVLFLKMKDGYTFDAALHQKICQTIEKELSYEHVPGFIMETPEIPHNMNAKKMETTVKRLINKMPYNADTVTNPECLEFYRLIPPYED